MDSPLSSVKLGRRAVRRAARKRPHRIAVCPYREGREDTSRLRAGHGSRGPRALPERRPLRSRSRVVVSMGGLVTVGACDVVRGAPSSVAFDRDEFPRPEEPVAQRDASFLKRHWRRVPRSGGERSFPSSPSCMKTGDRPHQLESEAWCAGDHCRPHGLGSNESCKDVGRRIARTSLQPLASRVVPS
jgi:hypothetical protein